MIQIQFPLSTNLVVNPREEMVIPPVTPSQLLFELLELLISSTPLEISNYPQHPR
jgi:hypothetical protein